MWDEYDLWVEAQLKEMNLNLKIENYEINKQTDLDCN
jgi:hypothetical protein